jgi:hypothetical protein
VTVVDVVDDWSGARIGATRTPAPGTRDVLLDDVKYVVYFEVDEDSVPSTEDADDIRVPAGLDLTVRRGGDGRPLPLEDYATSFRVTSGDRTARAVSTIEVPEEGRYRIRAGAAPGADEPALVLGRPVGRRVLRLGSGIAATAGGFILLAILGVIAVVLAVRRS